MGLRHHAAPLTMLPCATNSLVETNGLLGGPPMLRLRFRPLLALGAVVAVLAFAMTDADARAGRGGGFGSRGSQTFSAPPSTATSPSARPIERSMTQPGQPGSVGQRAPSTSPLGGVLGRPGVLRGVFPRFLGAGPFGRLVRHRLLVRVAGL